MVWTGTMIFAFLLYHLLHFTVGVTNPDDFSKNNPEYYTSNAMLGGKDMNGKIVAFNKTDPKCYQLMMKCKEDPKCKDAVKECCSKDSGCKEAIEKCKDNPECAEAMKECHPHRPDMCKDMEKCCPGKDMKALSDSVVNLCEGKVDAATLEQIKKCCCGDLTKKEVTECLQMCQGKLDTETIKCIKKCHRAYRHDRNMSFHKQGFPPPPPGMAMGGGMVVYERPDVYYMVVKGFQNWIISLAYIIGVILLGFHLSHAIQSAFQTLGWNHPKYFNGVITFSNVFSIIIVLCLISIPITILTGLVGGCL